MGGLVGVGLVKIGLNLNSKFNERIGVGYDEVFFGCVGGKFVDVCCCNWWVCCIVIYLCVSKWNCGDIWCVDVGCGVDVGVCCCWVGFIVGVGYDWSGWEFVWVWCVLEEWWFCCVFCVDFVCDYVDG